MRHNLQNQFETRRWRNGPDQSRSGDGSSLEATAALRAALPQIFADYEIKTFLDAPCGDWFWMQHVDLSQITYLGADISSEIVDELQLKYSSDNVSFQHLDVTSDPLPKADMMMCRDCLFHLKFWLRWAFYKNFVASGIQYLLSTINYPQENVTLRANGGWKPYNPMLAPFYLPDPMELIHETSNDLPSDWREIHKRSDAKKHRSLGIWTREQIIKSLQAREEAEAIAN